MSEPTGDATAPAGWYPDPAGAPQPRYWEFQESPPTPPRPGARH